MKKTVMIAFFLGVFIAVSVVLTLGSAEESLSQGVIRLHVRANSNLQSDQELKLKVRDRILKDTGVLFQNVSDTANAKLLTKENMEFIQDIAQDEVINNGYNYPVKVSFGKSTFPERTYSGLCLPAGTYEALVVQIGSAEGDNWWCVMFPPLCFVEESCEGISNQSEQILIENIGKDSYEMISGGKPKIKFKVYEWWKSITK